jgi:pimeloyl-ACP methyl ester carboxylesterase
LLISVIWPFMRPSQSQFLNIRGLRYHVRTWGDAAAPKLFMLHGWMDVSASFQFLVDALTRDWYVMAPDWRGYGLTEWPHDGYWFQDYIGDLDALLTALAPDAPVNLVGHSLGGNVASLYAGVRPHRVKKLVSLDGFGIPSGAAADAPDKLRKWLDALANPLALRPYASLAEAADRLQKTNPRLRRDRAEFLAAHWAEVQPDGSARLQADPKHKLPFPTVSHAEEWVHIWRGVTAPVLWVLASESHIKAWAIANDEEWHRRMAAFRDLRLERVEQAGHMVHHDQPERVASLIEEFLPESGTDHDFRPGE